MIETPSGRRELITHHLDKADLLLEQTEKTHDLASARVWIQQALAHSTQARALQEEERLDGCTRHHGQSRP